MRCARKDLRCAIHSMGVYFANTGLRNRGPGAGLTHTHRETLPNYQGSDMLPNLAVRRPAKSPDAEVSTCLTGRAAKRSRGRVGRLGAAGERPSGRAPRRQGARAAERSLGRVGRSGEAIPRRGRQPRALRAARQGRRAAERPRGRAGEGREGAGAGGAGAAGAARRADSWIRSSSKPVPNQFQTSSKPVPNPVPNPPHIGI